MSILKIPFSFFPPKMVGINESLLQTSHPSRPMVASLAPTVGNSERIQALKDDSSS